MKINPRPGMAFTQKGAQSMVQALVNADYGLDPIWSAVIFLVIGALAGYLADQVWPGNKLGILWSIVAGCLGSLIGGYILRMLPEQVSANMSTFIAALAGALVLVPIGRMVLGGRNNSSSSVTSTGRRTEPPLSSR